jgi:excinuclease ABC subunit A
LPPAILVRGARANNLKNIDVDVPLWKWVMLTGLSGSGKSSLAISVLYGEGLRRYLEGLSAYTRRRIGQVGKPDVDSIDHLPSALALKQRPAVPGRRSTVGTMTELLNVVRLMFSRLGSHVCPNGHRLPAEFFAGAQQSVRCPTCSVVFEVPSAESFAFNTLGMCPGCDGLGTRDEVDLDTLVPDPSKTVAGGAVAPWSLAGRGYMPQVAAVMGVRIDVPYRDLTAGEQAIILDGPPEQHQVTLTSKKGRALDATMVYESGRRAVEQAVATSTSETTRERLKRFFTTDVCPVCHGTRLRPEALESMLLGRNVAEVSHDTLTDLMTFVTRVAAESPTDMRPVAKRLATELADAAAPLLRLGLEYLSLDRRGGSLSTGERQRIELSSTLRARSTGMLYVLDEPSVGLHPANVDALATIVGGLVHNGNSVVMVDHDVALMRSADHIIEIGPGSGRSGGTVVAQGTATTLAANTSSVTGPFLLGDNLARVRATRPDPKAWLSFTVDERYTLHAVRARIPSERLTVVTGMSGSGKTTLILDSLVPAFVDDVAPPHVRITDTGGIKRLKVIDSSPIGRNSRSTPATYCGAFDPIRRLYAQASGLPAANFSYNTKAGQCPACRGLGELSVDLQYLPDLVQTCPTCEGARYNPDTLAVTVQGLSIAEVLSLNVVGAIDHFAGTAAVAAPLRALNDVGMGYLCLGEPTPGLSGGEAQRLRLSGGLRDPQSGTLYVLDEPSIGLHPRDVQTLLGVLDRLLHLGATVVAIDHDLDVIANADHVIDMGPGGGPDGGRIIFAGNPSQLAADETSVTGRWLAAHLARHA